MEQPVLIIDAPDLNDETVLYVHHFLNEVTRAFEAHYYQQLKQSCRQPLTSPVMDDPPDDGMPF